MELCRLLFSVDAVCCSPLSNTCLPQSIMPRTLSGEEISKRLLEAQQENDSLNVTLSHMGTEIHDLKETNKTLKTSNSHLHVLIRGLNEVNACVKTQNAGMKRRIVDLEEESSRKMKIISDHIMEMMGANNPAVANAPAVASSIIALAAPAVAPAAVASIPVVAAMAAPLTPTHPPPRRSLRTQAQGIRQIGVLHATGAMGRRNAASEDANDSSDDDSVVVDEQYFLSG